MNTIYDNFKSVFEMTWPMLFISIILVASVRIAYLIKHKEEFKLYKEILLMLFMLYILSLFQIVTAQDINSLKGNNLIPFTEIFRYKIGEPLFIKNVIGNMFLFLPYGFFVGLFADIKKPLNASILIIMASLAIELTQTAIGRIFDVDDIILNLAGGMIGYYIFLSLDKIGNLAPNFLKSKKVLNIITSILLIIVVFFIFLIIM